MAKTHEAIDISESPELLRLVDEVRSTGVPRVLKRGDEDLAVLTPVKPKSSFQWRELTEEDFQAFRSAAGSWRGHIDVEEFIKDNYERRRLSSRPSVDL